MILHPDLMIYELLEIYFKITNENYINLNILEKSLYTLENIINTNENTHFNYNFKDIINNFLNQYQDYIDTYNNTLYLNCDLAHFLDAILENKNFYSEIDQTICTYLENIAIFKSLNINIPHKEMQDYFILNKEIITTYSNIAKLETMGIKNNLLIYYLKKLNAKLTHELTKLDETNLLKIKICCADLNNCLNNDVEMFENSAWHIALFSNDALLKSKINYAKLEYLANELSFYLEDYEDFIADTEDLKELLSKSSDTEDNSDLNIFLSYFFLELSNYLNTNELSTFTKEELIMKKYLLLSTPELHKIEEYYLKTSNLVTTLPQINPTYYAKTTFDIICGINLR